MTRFGINAQRLAGQRFGVGRYLEYVIRNGAEMLAPDERMSIFVREALTPEDYAHLTAKGPVTAKHIGPNVSGLLWENTLLPPHLGDVDVLFGPSYTLPLSFRGKGVVAIHSVAEKTSGAHPWWYDYTYSQYYRWSARHADRVIVPCESTLREVAFHYGVAEDRIDIVPQGADPSFQPVSDEAALREARVRWLGEDVPYFLFVGKLSQRRNIPALIEAFALLKKKRSVPHKLLLFGPNHVNLPLEDIIDAFGVRGAVVQTDGKIESHEELVPVYSGADAFVHPSIYEGWSITTVEALACGTAVIAAERGGLSDVIAGHGLMIPDPTPAALAEAMDHVLTDEAARAELERRARLRGSTITWDDTARRTLASLRRAAAG